MRLYSLRSLLSGFALVACALGQNAPPPLNPAEVFNRARTRLLADAVRMPRYTCAQNITRNFYRPPSADKASCSQLLEKRDQRKHELQVFSWDKLQLDVAIIDNHEIHSWPGESKFDEAEIQKMVNNGPLGSGDFRNFIAAVFAGSATVRFSRHRVVNGKSLMEYTFSVDRNASRYEILIPPADIVTAYDGSFLLDPKTDDLVQLSVKTAELPAETHACQAVSEIQYGRIDIHGHEVLIPNETDLRMVYRNGREAMATTSYSSCHEYTSTSVLRFDDASANETPIKPVAEKESSRVLPDGIHFTSRILTPIDSETPAGKALEGVLRTPLRAKDKSILAPQGARIHARLVRLARHNGSMDYFEVGVRLESVEVNGARVKLHAAQLDRHAVPVDFASANPEDLEEQMAELPAPPPRNVGLYFFPREKLRVARIDGDWITTSATSENSPAPARDNRQQVLQTELQKIILAVRYSQKATELVGKDDRSNPAEPSTLPAQRYSEYPDLPEIISYRQKALDAGAAANTNVLNTIYPGLGDEFNNQFLKSLSLFIQSVTLQERVRGTAQGELLQSLHLSNEWADWYGIHREGIEKAIVLTQLNAEWPTITPSPLERREIPNTPSADMTAQTVQATVAPREEHSPVDSDEVKPPVKEGSDAANAAGSPPNSASPASTSAPAGIVIAAELSKSIDAKKNKAGDMVEAKTTGESHLPGAVVLPRDTKIVGRVSNTKARGKDSPGSMVEITFDHAVLKDNRQIPLQLTLQAVGRPVQAPQQTADPSITQSAPVSASAPPPVRSAASGNAASAPQAPPVSNNPDADSSIPGETSSRDVLDEKSQGMIGFDGVALSATPQSATISAAKGNVHLDKGTQLILRTP